MKCDVCGVSPQNSTSSIYRVSEKGVVPAIWRCAKHLSPEDQLRLGQVMEITGLIESHNQTKH